jgi:hypothetical protein
VSPTPPVAYGPQWGMVALMCPRGGKGGGSCLLGDSEITGIHVSDGDATTGGILGAKLPDPFNNGWRVFYTQQHGDNVTYEILKQQ